MEIKVISELKALEDKMRERHEVERRWKIGQTVAICIGVAGVIVSIVL